MHFVDTHTHLTEVVFESRLESVLAHAATQGVSRFIIPTYDMASLTRARLIAKAYTGVYYAAGIHPLFINTDECKVIRQFIGDENCIAIGETGLDYIKPGTDKKRQKDGFIQQLEFAREFALPVILHCRKAHEEMLTILRDFPDIRGVFHSCSFSAEHILPFLQSQSSFYVGFSGVITRSRAKKIRQLATAVPLNKILLETDSPFIGTADHPPPTSEPADTAAIAAEVASAKKLSVAEVAEVTSRNSEDLFSLLPVYYNG